MKKKKSVQRKYCDFDEEFKYLVRSKYDIDIKKSFDLEIKRAVKFIVNDCIRKGQSFLTAYIKSSGSYGKIITDMAFIYINKSLSKNEKENKQVKYSQR